jgi:hypothetical protein
MQRRLLALYAFEWRSCSTAVKLDDNSVRNAVCSSKVLGRFLGRIIVPCSTCVGAPRPWILSRRNVTDVTLLVTLLEDICGIQARTVNTGEGGTHAAKAVAYRW